MTVAQTDGETERPQGPGPARRVLRRGWRVVAGVLVSIIGFGFAVVALMALVLSQGPLTLPGWVSDRIEAQVNDGLNAGRVSLDRMDIAMGPGWVPQVRLRNVGLWDGRGSEIARLNEVGAAFDFARLVRGNVVPEALAVSGAQITIRRRTDGSMDLSLGGAGASGSLAGVLDAIDRVFAEGPLAQVGRIGASELTITLEDARADRLWQVTGGRLFLTQTDSQVEIAVNFDVFNGTEELASTALTFRSEKGSPAARIGARIRNAASGDIALQSPVLAFLGVLDAPISGSLNVELGDDAGLRSFAGTLEIGEGAVTPGPGWEPVTIDRGRAYFTYDPAARRIDFSELSVESAAAAVELSGQTFLEDLRPDGWPSSFVGQFRLARVMAAAEGWLPEPVELRDGLADLKLQMQPFRLTLGALTLHDGDTTVRISGAARSRPEGPDLSLDLTLDRIGHDRLFQLWPERLMPKTREWLAANILGGEISEVRAGLRRAPGQPDRRLLGLNFDDGSVRFMRTMPAIEGASGHMVLDDNRLTVTADAGHVTAPEGGELDVTGTVFVVPDVTVRPQPAEVRLQASGPVTAALSLLDEEPLNVMQRAGRPVDIAEGRAEVDGRIDLSLRERLSLKDLSYRIEGSLYDVSSDKLVKGRALDTPVLALSATETGVEIGGEALLGRLPLDVTWKQVLGEGAASGGTVAGTVEISQKFLQEFGIDLPEGSVTGKGSGHIEMDLSGEVPRFSLTSDLAGVAMKIESIAWTKPASAKGRLLIEGTLGEHPSIDRVEIEGGGLTASGSVQLNADGTLDKAVLTSVQLDGWLDAPVTLVGRGKGEQPGVQVNGGTLDFRKANFGKAGGTGGGPVSASLDRLYIAEGITLTSFRGEFSTRGGFGGNFNARLNGGGAISGTVVPQKNGSALKVTSSNAGDVLRDANLGQRVRGGAMVLTLVPTTQTGVYSGQIEAQNVRVKGTPALAGLLDAISVVGLLQQLNGDGVVFDRVQAFFTLTPNAVNFRESSAIGASMGLSVEGLYELGTGRLDLQGVISPVYIINSIGAALTRRGEGLFGFNYRVTGTSENPKVQVNPLSILTPGMFRELFRAPPPKVR